MGEELAHPGGPKRVRCARFLKSAQAAEARLERARNSPILPGRSESVVRVFLRRRFPNKTINNARLYPICL